MEEILSEEILSHYNTTWPSHQNDVVLWQQILPLILEKDEGHVFLSMEFQSFYMEHTQGEVNHADGQVPKPSVLDDLLGVSSTSMDAYGLTKCNPCLELLVYEALSY